MAINPVEQSIFEKLGLTRKNEPTPTNRLGQSDFLKLMTTQLNNQDPMKPMDGGDFFNQIAQFTSVSGIQDLQKSFATVAEAMFSGQALQASSLVGRNVMIESSTAVLQKDGLIEGSIELPSVTDKLMINIYSSSGELVKSMDMGLQQGGVVNFSWNGQLKDGESSNPGVYEIRAEAVYGRETYAQEVWIKERIESVTFGDGLRSLKLNMSGNTDISLSQIKKLL